MSAKNILSALLVVALSFVMSACCCPEKRPGYTDGVLRISKKDVEARKKGRIEMLQRGNLVYENPQVKEKIEDVYEGLDGVGVVDVYAKPNPLLSIEEQAVQALKHEYEGENLDGFVLYRGYFDKDCGIYDRNGCYRFLFFTKRRLSELSEERKK